MLARRLLSLSVYSQFDEFNRISNKEYQSTAVGHFLNTKRFDNIVRQSYDIFLITNQALTTKIVKYFISGRFSFQREFYYLFNLIFWNNIPCM